MPSPRRDESARSAWAELLALFDAERPRILAAHAEHDLRPPQAIALRMIDEPTPMGHVAAQLACDRSTMTWITDRLEERGLLIRSGDPDDRRVTLLELTEEGRRVRSELELALSEPPRGFDRLTAAELAQLARLVGKTNAGGRA